jgi:hypothetical protein
MNFELPGDFLALRDRARAFAAAASERGADIDRTAVVGSDLARDARALCHTEPLGLAIVIEELAATSAALAMSAAAPDTASALNLAGLRGAPILADGSGSQLVLAAVALGIGRSALDAALGELRRSTVTRDGDVEKPHWVVADAATELDAARLLTYRAARSMADADIAMARLMASAAASRAVDAALRVTGPAGLNEGGALERLSRDVRAVALVMGTEEHQRAMAADALFPR